MLGRGSGIALENIYLQESVVRHQRSAISHQLSASIHRESSSAILAPRLLLTPESRILNPALQLVAQDPQELSRPSSDVRSIQKVTNHSHRIRASRKNLTGVLQSYPTDRH
jgi:hypothetical protein